ncbi:unnamed protein product, partial [marine sediment metagenome]
MRVACIQPQIFQDRNKCYLQIELLLKVFLEKNQNCDIICLPERWVPYFRDPAKNLQNERGNDYAFIKNLAKEYNIKILSGAIWEKTEEEKIAILLNDKHIFEIIERLSNGPIPLEWLREGFIEEFPEKNFEEIIDTLVDKQFVFINQIGLVEKYVLLLKEVKAERIPPDSVIEYIDDKPELIDLLLPKVQEYFSEYEKKKEEEIKQDSFILFKIMADSKKYNVLSE